MDRRQLITGLIAFAAAPAIVRADSLMKIRGERYFTWEWSSPLLPDIGWQWEKAFSEGVSFDEYAKAFHGPNGQLYKGTWTFFGKDRNIYSDEQIGFRKEEYPSGTAGDARSRLNSH